jgi:hypothetical protein
MADLDRNKKNVIAFYEWMFNDCRPREAIERYVGAEYSLTGLERRLFAGTSEYLIRHISLISNAPARSL